MANSVTTVFQFQQATDVRVIIENGEPLFHANDLCAVLEYVNPHDALRRHVDKSDLVKREVTSDVVKHDTTSRARKSQLCNFVLEAGMWALILGSETPKAKEVKRWVTGEVLPSIRKTGSYTIAKAAIETISPTQYHNLRVMVNDIADSFHFKGSWEHWAWRHIRALSNGEVAAKLPATMYDQAVTVLKALEVDASLFLSQQRDREKEFLRQDRTLLTQRVQMALPIN